MARQTFSITMDETLVKKLEESAKKNHRRRGPEVNVAVEFYLKYQGLDIESDLGKSNDIKAEATKVDVPNEVNNIVHIEAIEGTDIEDSGWEN